MGPAWERGYQTDNGFYKKLKSLPRVAGSLYGLYANPQVDILVIAGKAPLFAPTSHSIKELCMLA